MITDPSSCINSAARARTLLELHRAPELLTVVNVWDVVSARVVAGTEGTRALATASHSTASTLGYRDGEVIPFAEMLDMVGRIVAATDLPVSADLVAGYGDAPRPSAERSALGWSVRTSRTSSSRWPWRPPRSRR